MYYVQSPSITLVVFYIRVKCPVVCRATVRTFGQAMLQSRRDSLTLAFDCCGWTPSSVKLPMIPARLAEHIPSPCCLAQFAGIGEHHKK